MNKVKKNISKVSRNVILRNLILAACVVIVFFVLAALALNVFTRHNNREQVPDFLGMSIAEAQKAAKQGGLRLEIIDSLYVPAYDGGAVLDQQPKAGTEVKSGRRIFLTVNAHQQRMLQIPYVSGYSLRQAKNILEVAGFEIDKLVFRNDIAANNVLQQQFNGEVVTSKSHIKAEQGSGVTLVVGMDPQKPHSAMPKVVGFPLKEAKSRLWEAGFNVGEVVFDEGISLLDRNDAKVYEQTPEQGKRLTLGTTVTLKLAIDQEKIDGGNKKSDSAAKTIMSRQAAEDAAAAAAAAEAQNADNQ